jgi:Flp pilus assembly protein TadG
MFQALTGVMTSPLVLRLRAKVQAFAHDRRGTAAIEFAFFVGFLSVATMNVAEISVYIFQRMQVQNAAQMAVQAAWKTCNTSALLPATTNCSGLNTALTNSVQSTALGSRVQLESGSPSEGYYCVTSQNVLQYMSSVDNKPVNCSAVGNAAAQPADYITIQATFNYAPMFSGLTVGGLFPTTIQQTTTMRLQ